MQNYHWEAAQDCKVNRGEIKAPAYAKASPIPPASSLAPSSPQFSPHSLNNLSKPQTQSNQSCHWFRILQWLPMAQTALHRPSSMSCHVHLAHPLFSVIFPGVQTHLGVTWVRHIILILSVLICEMGAINKTFLRGLLLVRACLPWPRVL